MQIQITLKQFKKTGIVVSGEPGGILAHAFLASQLPETRLDPLNG